ncbi:hypothetical protein HON36_03170 [Candidatus Parcubacteria bacterium]|jgi:hypothetical protein|nr:hypothetical protein [Candidatus Parcubacteria bacterium]MBT7228919.1 hypothetical protein [Candidatus Parcubacteria bacterium]
MTKKQKCKKARGYIVNAQKLFISLAEALKIGDFDIAHATKNSILINIDKIVGLSMGKDLLGSELIKYARKAFKSEGETMTIGSLVAFHKIFDKNTTLENEMLILSNVPENLYTTHLINFFNEDRSRLKKFGIKKVLINNDVGFDDIVLEPWPDFIMIDANIIISREKTNVSIMASLLDARRTGQIHDYRLED